MSAWAVHQDKEVFGEDANIFRPERWLDSDAQRMAAMDRAFFSVCSLFSHGQR
jgi:cytochrome P450